jgi:7-carboxy-7-deazaguanine synthase
MTENPDPQQPRLRITEIFFSLQGEARTVGFPTVFVRLTGCPLRCTYCDTEYAFTGGEWMSLEQILAAVASYQSKHVCVTGGEPLAQKQCRQLLEQLCDAGYAVSLETSGAMDICEVDTRVSRVMDLKTPSSGEMERNRYENIACLSEHDQVKFVIGDREDFDWAVATCQEHQLWDCCEVLFSPVFEKLKPGQLAEWVLEQKVPVRFQLQLHKLLWGDKPGV